MGVEPAAAPLTKEDLPTAIIIKNVPLELFNDDAIKSNFADLFYQLESDAHIDYLKSFQRVRVVFHAPEHATAARLLVEHHSFCGQTMQAFFAQVCWLFSTS